MEEEEKQKKEEEEGSDENEEVEEVEEEEGEDAENEQGEDDDQKTKRDPEKEQRELLKRFLLAEDFALEDEEAASTMVDSLVDWLDADDDVQDKGAESSYYSSQDPPYIASNGPIMFPEELLLIQGWNEELLYGENEQTGIIDYLTIGGRDGKININTAPALVLQALSTTMTEEFVSDIIEFRENEDNRDVLEQKTWYSQVIPGDVVNDIKELVTVKSSYFHITVTAGIESLQRTGNGVIHRKDNHEQTLLYWKVE